MNTKQKTLLTLKILDIDIMDFNREFNVEEPCKSSVQVNTKILIKGEEHYLDFQTSNTGDVGAISTDLSAYHGTQQYDDFEECCEKHGLEPDDVEKEIKEMGKINKLYAEYIELNYEDEDEEFYNGMDANSENDLLGERL